VSGDVTVKLFKGCAEVVAVETPNTIFDEKLATFMKSSAFNQNASAGFIEIYTLQMRLAQEKERFALLTIGEEKNKKKFLPLVKELRDLGFQFYATEHTHEYYEKQGIDSILIHKMYKKTYPNLEDGLRQNLFDLIINIPYDNQFPEAKDDEKVIKKWAVNNEVPIVRDFETAEKLIEKMKKRMIVRKQK
jgi:argininosuccinate synthase